MHIYLYDTLDRRSRMTEKKETRIYPCFALPFSFLLSLLFLEKFLIGISIYAGQTSDKHASASRRLFPIRVRRRAHYEPTRKTRHDGCGRRGAARRGTTLRKHTRKIPLAQHTARYYAHVTLYMRAIRREVFVVPAVTFTAISL